SVEEIEHGFEVSTSRSGGISIYFLPRRDAIFSRALQWDLPVGSVRDGRDGPALTTCLQVGPFVTIPQHGFLRLQESAGGRLECAGTVVRHDMVSGVMEGWAMEVGTAELVYVHFPPSPGRRIYHFRSHEAVDWLQSSLDQHTVCARALILPPDALSPLLGLGVRQDIGVRPGVSVRWTDTAGMIHTGVADREFTVIESPMLTDGAICSTYDAFRDIIPIPRRQCEVDITSTLSRYMIRSGAGVTVHPAAMYSAARIHGYRY
ncbi:hypothetical protein KBB85_06150, partial [Patescibacteria group bacterium]|nr:hypothetical protein [Patescibacteria group bacterium]